MANKPAVLATWQPGETPYKIKFLCATMNWLTSFCSNLCGENPSVVESHTDNKLYIKVDGDKTGKPILKIKGEAGMKFKSGEDSNVVISTKPDTDGYYAIDVYYK